MMRRCSLMVLVSLVLWGCGDGSITNDVSPTDTIAVDTGISVDTVSPQDIPVDAAEVEDLTEPDCEPGTGCFGEPCDGPDDCLSSYCVPHMGDSVCSDLCDATCPAGWAC